MTIVGSGATQSTLVYKGDLPFLWEYLDEATYLRKKKTMGTTNVDTLRAILALEQGAKERADADFGVAQELQRIEHKLDLLMSLTAQLLARDVALPRELPCRLTAQGLEWDDDEVPEVGRKLLIHIYLSHKFPRASIFPVVVREVTSFNSVQSIKVEFIDLPEAVHDLLERFIFQYHRRQIARTQKG
jgi:hypothetical protein